MRHIILWELKQRKSYIFWWTASTVGIIALLLLVYPSIHSQADQLNQALNQLPSTLKNLKTGGSQVDIASPIGYLNSQLYYATLPLLQIIMAVGLGGSLLARDEQNHTLELLLARPISRSKILAAKAISGVLMMLIVTVFATMATLSLSKIVDLQISSTYLLLTSLYTMLFSLSFGAIAFTLTAVSNSTRRASIAVAVGVSFGGYIMASLSGLSHYIETPAKFFPYHYFNPAQILTGQVSASLNIYLVGVALLACFVSWVGFCNRDIN